MQKKDMLFLRRQVKKGGVVTNCAGVYVDTGAVIASRHVLNHYTLDEDDLARHMELIQAVLSPQLGRAAHAAALSAHQEDFLALRRTRWSVDKLTAVVDRIVQNCELPDPYYLVLFELTVDLPSKASDGAELEDGAFLYNGIGCAICPAKLSAPALGPTDSDVSSLTRRWTIGKPKTGFLYPALNEGREDADEAVLFSKNPTEEVLFERLFALNEDEPVLSAADQRAAFQAMAEDMGIRFASLQSIAEGLWHEANQPDAAPLDKDRMASVLREAGADMDHYDDAYEKAVHDTPLSADALSGRITSVSCGDTVIRMPAEKASSIRMEHINGIDCLVVPVNGEVAVNGVASSGR